ncbi:MAG: ATP synthase F0 subunit A [Clostridiales bacterium]|nr:MAG: ATP synthase F0 subunit A [Clostridiales bacterium]
MLGTQEFGPKIAIEFGDFAISESVVVMWIIMAVIMIFVTIATRKKDDVPTGLQNFVEMLVDSIYKLVDTTMGEKGRLYAPYMGTLVIFLALANIAGMFGLRPPTADVNTTMALAIMTFLMIHISGLYYRKGAYLKGFLEPMPFLLPLNIIGELATPISLGFRLFGNIVGGLIIMSLLYGALGWFAIIPVPAVLHIYFDLFAGFLQSFIFMMLTMVFVAMAIE